MSTVGADPEALERYAVAGTEVARQLRTRGWDLADRLAAVVAAPSELGLPVLDHGHHLQVLADAWHESDDDVGRLGVAIRAADRSGPFGSITLAVTLTRLLGERAHDDRPWEVDDEQVASSLAVVRGALDPGGWGVRGDDLAAIRDELARLTGAEADAVLAGLTDEEMARWHDQMREGRFKGGWSREQREELYVVIGERVSLATWRRFGSHTDEIDPAPTGILEDGARPETVAAVEGYEYRPFDAGAFATDGDDSHPVSLDDVLQGGIGDCYLISSMQALAVAAPDTLERMVSPNPNGTYTITFGDGRRTVVSSDVVFDGDVPAFARLRAGGEAELWPMLVEKAYAQREGGWEPIVGGHPHDAVEALTGFEGSKVDADDVTLEQLASAHDRGDVLHIGTIHAPDDLTRQEWLDGEAPEPFTRGSSTFERLHPQHAFIISDVDLDADEITVRNPWNPTAGDVVLTLDELRLSSNNVYVNEVP